jgi:hypothetical protein
VEVVKDQDQRLGLGEVIQQRPDGAVAAVALVLGGDLAAGGQRGQGGEDVCELGLDGAVEGGEPAGFQAGEVFIQRVDEHRERQVVLELRRRAGQDQVPARAGAGGGLAQQRGLADPRFARELDRGGAAPVELAEDLLERGELARSADKVPGKQSPTLLFRRVWAAPGGRGAGRSRRPVLLPPFY